MVDTSVTSDDERKRGTREIARSVYLVALLAMSAGLFEVARLDFQAPDLARFPCLRLAFDALRGEETAPAVLNAANEVAVARFLDRRLRFTQIAEVVERTLQSYDHGLAESLDGLLETDRAARALAEQHAARLV